MMTNTLQGFLAAATEKAAADLAEAFIALPEDKRLWSPTEGARPAIDLVAECALLTGYTAGLLQPRSWPDGQYDLFFAEKAEAIAQGWDEIHPRLMDSARRLAAAIAAVPEAELADEVEIPWGKQTVQQLTTYPYWNMSYHLGQVNYIASLLGRPA